jgi:hypothetical protein
MAIHLASFIATFYRFWIWVDEVLSPSNIFYAFCFCMACDDTLKGLPCGSFDVEIKSLVI